MPDLNEFTPPGGALGGLAGGIGAIIAGVFWLRAKLSSSSVDRAGDRAEVNIIEVLQNDNAKLREMLAASENQKLEYFQKSVESAAQVNSLQEKVTMLTEKIEELNNEVQRLRASVESGKS